MKKALYMILLIVEFLVGFWLLSRVTMVAGWIYFAIVAAVWVGLVKWLLAKRTNDRRTEIAIALVTLLPAAAGLAGLCRFAWGMSAGGR